MDTLRAISHTVVFGIALMVGRADAQAPEAAAPSLEQLIEQFQASARQTNGSVHLHA
jgi:hypothetical protein